MNNFENITKAGLIRFPNEGDFYFIQIFQRRKDNPELEHHVVRLKSYCVYSWEELDGLMPRIIQYCENFNARAYIRLNRQNATDVALRCIAQLSENIRLGNFNKCRQVWDSISGQKGAKDYWVLDVDKEHLDVNFTLIDEIKSILLKHFELKRDMTPNILEIATKTGMHLIVPPFDSRVMEIINKQFQDLNIPKIDIQKDANTILYTL